MALKPKISVSLENSKCNTLVFREETGIYVSTENETGWGTPNINTNDIESSFVKIYDNNLTLLETVTFKDNSIDLYLNAVTAPIPSEFQILGNHTWTQSDGIFKIEYQIFNGSTYFNNNNNQRVLFLCNLCNCINSVKTKYVITCDKIKKEEYHTQLKELELLKYGIESAYSCGNFNDAMSLLTSANKICTALSDCGCGCGDC